MSLPAGDWKANMAGYETVLRVQNVASGEVAGELVGYMPGPNMTFTGIWDEIAQRVTFLTKSFVEETDASREYFEGYLARTPHNAKTGEDVVWLLAGFVQSVGSASASAHGEDGRRRSRYPWYAQITEIVE